MYRGQNKRFRDKINDLGTKKMVCGQRKLFWDTVNNLGTK